METHAKASMGKVEAAKQELTVYLPDTRGVTVSRWGRGNTKTGMRGVYTYSRLPGLAGLGGTCPGSTRYCRDICYANRVQGTPAVWAVWAENAYHDAPPTDPLPSDAEMVRIHVGGDFDSVRYIEEWAMMAKAYPQVDFFGFTRSWRVAQLLPALEALRALPNVQLFASVDKDMAILPPEGWRRAWLADDPRLIDVDNPAFRGFAGPIHDTNRDLVPVCPEELGRKENCQECNYCVKGQTNDIVFLLH